MEKDFFISYTADDSDWAEWIAWQLEAANYTVVLQAWDFLPGSNFVVEMDRATKLAKKTIAVVSDSYLERLFTQSEWAAAFARDPVGAEKALIPVRVRPCRVQGILAQLVYLDLIDLNENSARKKLLDGIGGARAKPSSSPVFPGRSNLFRPSLFPGNRPPSPSTETTFATRSFVCARVTANGLLDLDMPANPYCGAFDPTEMNPGFQRRAFIILWLPKNENISPMPQNLTPVVAICTLDPEDVLRRIEQSSRYALALLQGKPREMRDDIREELLTLTASALKYSFIAAVTIPSIVLGASKKKPILSYQAILNLFLFPLADMHRRIGFEELRIWLANTGKLDAAILKLAKQGAKALFPAKQGATAELVSTNQFWGPFVDIGRLLAWAINSHYNSGNSKWITILREKLECNELD